MVPLPTGGLAIVAVIDDPICTFPADVNVRGPRATALVIERVAAPPDALNVTGTALLLICKIPLLTSTALIEFDGGNTAVPPPVI
jgi:hypothetical protein